MKICVSTQWNFRATICDVTSSEWWNTIGGFCLSVFLKWELKYSQSGSFSLSPQQNPTASLWIIHLIDSTLKSTVAQCAGFQRTLQSWSSPGFGVSRQLVQRWFDVGRLNLSGAHLYQVTIWGKLGREISEHTKKNRLSLNESQEICVRYNISAKKKKCACIFNGSGNGVHSCHSLYQIFIFLGESVHSIECIMISEW